MRPAVYQADKRKPIADRPAASRPRRVASTPPVQRAAAPAPYHALPASVGIGPANRTGLPNRLKNGIEALSGLPMDDVRVHRGSSRPATLQAHAYTQGSEIHLAPGQEHHLAHEAWHVVQQKQGRVRPMFDLNGTAINADAGLEGEADRMGQRAERTGGAPAEPAKPVQRAGIAAPVVQRSVLHIQNDEGDFVYYSDLEIVARGSRLTTFKDKAAAQKFDDLLAASSKTLGSAIVTSQNRDRRVPTPFGHTHTLPTAKVRHQDQGPHSLSFIAFEQRLQNRLRKGQQAELADQLITPEQAEAMMQAEYGLDDDSDVLKRYMLDYRSLYDEFLRRLKGDADLGIGSAFHLVARKLLQLNPYTTYNGPKSTNRGEDRHGVLGSNTLDSSARFKSAKGYQTYLQTRGDIFHSSDEEEEDHAPKDGATPFAFTAIPARERSYSRKSRASNPKKRKEKAPGPTKALDDSSSSADGKSAKKKARSTKAVEDVVAFYGHRFSPNTPGIRDGGECFWDTMRSYGFSEARLGEAATAAGLTVDMAVNVQQITKFVEELNRDQAQGIWVRIVTYDLTTLAYQSYLDIGDIDNSRKDDKYYVALFNDGENGHYVPELG